jgi:vacuolar protein sorting-associated protein 1
MMLQDANRLLHEYQESLNKLPKPLTADPTTEILTRISTFCDDVKGAVSGDRLKTLAQGNRSLYTQWKARIRGTAPDFRPFIDCNQYPKPSWPDTESVTPPEVAVEIYDLTKVRKVIAK